MDNGMKQILRRYLAEQNMFNIMELINTDAAKEDVIELFEKSVLYQNSQYQRMLLYPNTGLSMPQDQLDQLIDRLKKQQLRLPTNQRIHRLLQLLDQDTDCGCGGRALMSIEHPES